MRKVESGQALVLVLLSLSVVLTLILYILSRSITDVAVSTRQEESVRAFSAAEAGVERALVTGSGYTDIKIGDAKYTTTVTGISANSPDLPFPNPINSGDSVTVWFVSHDANGNLACPCSTGTAMKVCWGIPGTPPFTANTPAVEVTVYDDATAGNMATIQVGRGAIDPYVGRPDNNGFIVQPDGNNCHIGNQTYQFSKTLLFQQDLGITNAGTQNGLQLAQVKMLYNNVPQPVGITLIGGGNLPSQGSQIDSIGVAGKSNRRVVVYKWWPVFPFSSNTIVSPSEISQP